MSRHVQVALARRTMSAWGMWMFAVAASAPMVVLVGGVVTTYASSQVTSVPLVFLLVGAVIGLLVVGYTKMSQRVPHSAPYYAILARGLGPRYGVAGGAVALVAYNAIQISLYGLFGAVASDLLGGTWWLWAGCALTFVGTCGVRAIALSTGLLAVVMLASLILITLFHVSALAEPAGGSYSWEGFSASGIFVNGIGSAVALCLAALMGIDAPASFAEEAGDGRAVTRGVFSSLLFLSGVYATAAWALGVAVGPSKVVAAAGTSGIGLPIAIMERQLGGFITPIAETMFILGIVTSMLAFHSVVARYAFAMAREEVLPAGLARAGSGTRIKAPVGGSLLQSTVATAVVGMSVVAKVDPVALFSWMSTLGALGLLCLLLATAVATLRFSRQDEGAKASVFVPLLGLILGFAVLAGVVINLLEAAPDSVAAYALLALLALSAVGGYIWAGMLSRARPDVFKGISHGRPDTHAIPDDVGVSF